MKIHKMKLSEALYYKNTLVELIKSQRKAKQALIVASLQNSLRITIERIEYLNKKHIWDLV